MCDSSSSINESELKKSQASSLNIRIYQDVSYGEINGVFWVRKHQKPVGPWIISHIGITIFVIFNKFSRTTRLLFFDKLKLVFDKKMLCE